jgi:hypothetical protein
VAAPSEGPAVGIHGIGLAALAQPSERLVQHHIGDDVLDPNHAPEPSYAVWGNVIVEHRAA